MIKILIDIREEETEAGMEMNDVTVADLQAAIANLEIAKTTALGQLMKMSESSCAGTGKTEPDKKSKK